MSKDPDPIELVRIGGAVPDGNDALRAILAARGLEDARTASEELAERDVAQEEARIRREVDWNLKIERRKKRRRQSEGEHKGPSLAVRPSFFFLSLSSVFSLVHALGKLAARIDTTPGYIEPLFVFYSCLSLTLLSKLDGGAKKKRAAENLEKEKKKAARRK